MPGGWDIKPEQLVHFLVGDEGAAFGRHHPVGHHLGTTLAVDVLGMPDEPEEPALETGFFAHLALRRLLVAFALFEFPLGIGPVLMHRAMYERDLKLPSLAPDDQTTGGLDDFNGSGNFHCRSSSSHCMHPISAVRAIAGIRHNSLSELPSAAARRR